MSLTRKLRPAFTLIETLLALGLSSGLLLVLFSLINSTAHYHVTGQDQIMKSQRLLGLMQDLRYDLHLVQSDAAWSTENKQTTLEDVSREATPPIRMEISFD